MSKLTPCPAFVLFVNVELYSSAFILARKTRESSITKWAFPIRVGRVKVVLKHWRDWWGFGEGRLAQRRVTSFAVVVLAAHDAAVLALKGNTAPRDPALPVVRSCSNNFAILDPVLFALLLSSLGFSWRLARTLLLQRLLKLCTAAADLAPALHLVM